MSHSFTDYNLTSFVTNANNSETVVWITIYYLMRNLSYLFFMWIKSFPTRSSGCKFLEIFGWIISYNLKKVIAHYQYICGIIVCFMQNKWLIVTFKSYLVWCIPWFLRKLIMPFRFLVLTWNRRPSNPNIHFLVFFCGKVMHIMS